jgi:hypothetical protein
MGDVTHEAWAEAQHAIERLHDALERVQREHGAPICVLVGEAISVCDVDRLESSWGRGAPYKEGGAVLACLPERDGLCWDGGGF